MRKIDKLLNDAQEIKSKKNNMPMLVEKRGNTYIKTSYGERKEFQGKEAFYSYLKEIGFQAPLIIDNIDDEAIKEAKEYVKETMIIKAKDECSPTTGAPIKTKRQEVPLTKEEKEVLKKEKSKVEPKNKSRQKIKRLKYANPEMEALFKETN